MWHNAGSILVSVKIQNVLYCFCWLFSGFFRIITSPFSVSAFTAFNSVFNIVS